MTKKKMEKLDLSNFFTSQNEDTGFKVLSDVDGKAKEEDTTI